LERDGCFPAFQRGFSHQQYGFNGIQWGFHMISWDFMGFKWGFRMIYVMGFNGIYGEFI
jgi:hypothetical protein